MSQFIKFSESLLRKSHIQDILVAIGLLDEHKHIIFYHYLEDVGENGPARRTKHVDHIFLGAFILEQQSVDEPEREVCASVNMVKNIRKIRGKSQRLFLAATLMKRTIFKQFQTFLMRKPKSKHVREFQAI